MKIPFVGRRRRGSSFVAHLHSSWLADNGAPLYRRKQGLVALESCFVDRDRVRGFESILFKRAFVSSSEPVLYKITTIHAVGSFVASDFR
jgi:hypothetical protein